MPGSIYLDKNLSFSATCRWVLLHDKDAPPPWDYAHNIHCSYRPHLTFQTWLWLASTLFPASLGRVKDLCSHQEGTSRLMQGFLGSIPNHVIVHSDVLHSFWGWSYWSTLLDHCRGVASVSPGFVNLENHAVPQWFCSNISSCGYYAIWRESKPCSYFIQDNMCTSDGCLISYWKCIHPLSKMIPH